MKNVTIIIVLILITGTHLFCQGAPANRATAPSYFGFSGLMFIPTAQTLAKNDFAFNYKTEPAKGDDLTLAPYSLNFLIAPFMDGLEVAFTNTYIYASNEQFGGVPVQGEMDSTNMVIPVIPSLKYRFMPMSESNFHVSMAIGVGAPYGVYYVVDKFFDLGIADFTMHGGIATKLTTYHAFAGATLALGSRSAAYLRSFPLQFSVEGAWGGSLNQLDEKEEAFLSLSVRHAWTASVVISSFYRVDQQPSVRDGIILDDKPTEKMGLGLSLIF